MAQKQTLPGLEPDDSLLNVIYVEISQMAIGYTNDLLKISALGSCVGLVIYPKKLKESDRCAIMGHVMLPESYERLKKKKGLKARFAPAKYSNLAVSAMVAKLERLGHKSNSLEAKMAGGAKMFGNSSDTFDIGKENVRRTKIHLSRMNIPLKNHFTGGNKGMNLTFSVRNYKLIVTPTGESPIIL
jgi:chemotaxis protein CheD